MEFMRQLGKGRTCWLLCLCALLAAGCAKQDPVTTVTPETPEASHVRRSDDPSRYVERSKKPDVKIVPEEKKAVAEKPADPVQVEELARKVKSHAARAEGAAAAARDANGQARSAAGAAEDAAGRAARAAAAGDVGGAGEAAAQAAAAAGRARGAADRAEAQAGVAQDSAAASAAAVDKGGLTAAGTEGDLGGTVARAKQAAETAESAEMAASAHAFVAEEHAAAAGKTVAAARIVKSVNEAAAQAEASANESVEAGELAKAAIGRAQKGATAPSDKEALAALQEAEKLAKDAARHAGQTEALAKRTGDRVDELTQGGDLGDEAVKSLRNAAKEASEAADRARAASAEATQAIAVARKEALAAARSGKPDDDKPAPKEAPKTPPRRREPIDFEKVPDLPKLPPRRTRPKGIVEATSKPAGSVRIVGRWQQVAGDTGPDFLPGGYVKSVIVLRADDVLEVTRTFGKDGDVSLTWRVGYAWNKDRSVLTVGGESGTRPQPASLKGFVLEGSGIRVLSATQSLPISLKSKRLQDGRLKLGSKGYKAVKAKSE